MRAFVASDDSAVSYQLREVLLRLGHDCPSSQVTSLALALPKLLSLLDPVAPPGTGAGHEPAPRNDSSGERARQATEPDLVFMVIGPSPDHSLAVLRDLRRRLEHSRLFAVGPTTDTKLVLRALREGAHEYLDQAELAGELSAALERFRSEGAGRRVGRTIAFLGPGGGTGTSMLAANVATHLAQHAGGCVLLDLHPETGDLAPLLDIKPDYTVADLCRNASRLDPGLMETFLGKHASGVRLLASPLRIADAVHVTAEGVHQALSIAAELAPYVVADVDRCLRDEAIQTLQRSDEILLVLRLDFLTLRNTRRVLDYLEEHRIRRDNLRLVVNRHKQAGELSPAEAQAALGAKIAHYISDDSKSVNRSINEGVPVVQSYPSAKISRQIIELAKSLQREQATS